MEEQNTQQVKAQKDRSNLKEWISSFAIAIILVIIIRMFFLGYAIVSGPSMLNTIKDGDRVFYAKIVKPHKGNVVVVTTKDGTKIIKRVIGMEGDRIEIKKGVLYINDVKQKENYIKEPMLADDFGPIVVPKGQIFVMGDNRNISADSRIFGTFNLSNQYDGRVFLEIYHKLKIY